MVISYTNCADIAIKGTGSSISGVQLLVTNLAPPIENTVTLPEFPGTNTAACDGKYLLDSRPSATMDASGKVSPSGVFTGKDLESKISTNCKDTYVPPPNAPAGNGNGNATAQPLNSGTAGGPMTTVAKSGATRRAVAVALVAMLLAVGMGDLFII